MYSLGRRRIINAEYIDSKRLGFVHCLLCCCQCFKDSDKLGETSSHADLPITTYYGNFVQTFSELEYFLVADCFRYLNVYIFH